MKSLKRSKKENKISSPKPKVLVIIGPTASGKSDLAVQIAKEFDGEIISADSRQVYKGLNIGSGKITKEEMGGVPHYLIDVVRPKKVFTVSDFRKHGKRVLKKVLRKEKLPIVAGGTGLYVDALIYDMTIPVVPPQKELRKRLECLSNEELLKRLKAVDPDRARVIDAKNKRRLIRAVEIVETTGKPVPELRKNSTYEVLKIGLTWPDGKLRERIRTRLYQRMEEGMVEEVRKLHSLQVRNGRRVSWERLEDLGLEYRYIARYLQGYLTKNEMLETLETEIWRYAKRQMTWFKKDKSIVWIDPSTTSNVQQKAFPIVRDFLARGETPSSDQ